MQVSVDPLHIPPLAVSVHVLVAPPESTNVGLHVRVATVFTGVGEVFTSRVMSPFDRVRAGQLAVRKRSHVH